MKNILITGATGNIGMEVIRYLFELNTQNEIYAGVRNIGNAKKMFQNYNKLQYRHFDFENPETFENALDNINMVFLLRPPHISDIDKYIKPLIKKIKEKGIEQIVFLSVQSAEKSKIIPHNKIERLITEYSLDYVFLRPSYFMQNLTTILYKDIIERHKIILPASKAKFNWIDIKNIAETVALIMGRFEIYKNKPYEITGYENKNFYEVATILSEVSGNTILFENVNPFKFFRIKKKEGMLTGMIFVMIILHILPRFQKEPEISDFYEKLTGKKPTSLAEFVKREQNKFKNF